MEFHFERGQPVDQVPAQGHHEDLLLVETQPLRPQEIQLSADAQAADDQDHGQAELEHHQQLAQPGPTRRNGETALEDRRRFQPGEMPGRIQPGQQPGDQEEPEQEQSGGRGEK